MSAGVARWRNSKLHNKSIYLSKMQEVSGLLAPDKEGTTFLRGNGNQLVVKGVVQEISTGKEISVKALLDSGCTGCTINREFVRKNKLQTIPIINPITVLNADGTENESGKITERVEVRFRIEKRHVEKIQFTVTTISGHDIFLGYDWLVQHNPDINWEKAVISMTRCPPSCGTSQRTEELWEHQMDGTIILQQLQQQVEGERGEDLREFKEMQRSVAIDVKIAENAKKEKKP